MYQHILVPVDGSDTSRHGLEEAIRLARLTQGRLRLIHVIDELSMSMAVSASAGFTAEWLDGLRESGEKVLADAKAVVCNAGLEVDGRVHDNFSGPLDVIVAAEARGWPAELIVLGTHGRRGIGRLMMGSGAENILRSAPVPVLLVRTPEPKAGARP